MVAAGTGEMAITVKENVPLVVPPAPSVTITLKLAGPAAVGVPDNRPAALMLRPLVKPDADQTNGATPVPVATANDCEYSEPTAAAGNVAGVAIVTAGAIVPVNGCPFCNCGLLLSVATTLYW